MSEVIQMITTYGILPVIVAAIIVIVIFMIKSQHNFNHKQQEINEKQQASNDAQEERLMAAFEKMFSAVAQIDRNTSVIHSKEEEEENRKVDEVIYQLLETLLNKTHANRVSCFLYHNGGRNVLGRSFQKMSMSHELVDSTTAPLMRQYQQMPRMMFPILNQKMAETGYYYIEDISTIQEVDAITYQSFLARGVKSAFVQAIKSSTGTVLGFMTVEYASGKQSLTKELKYCLNTKAAKISGVLEVTNQIAIWHKED